MELKPEGGLQERPAGQESSSKESEIFQGTVQLVVTSAGVVGGLLNFVGELRQDPRLRMYRLIADKDQVGMGIWLGLRQPLPLKTVLLGVGTMPLLEAWSDPGTAVWTSKT